MCNMTQQDKLDMLYTIQSILQTADDRLSWDMLPKRSSIQQALKFTNTLVAIEKPQQIKTRYKSAAADR